jgi:SAM-dependent methyltransferase
MRRPRSGRDAALCIAIAVALLVATGCTASSPAPGDSGPRYFPRTSPGVLFVPTPPDVGVEMLKLAGVTSNDLVYDLGSGDGRLVIAAAQLFGARGVGVELDAKLVQDSREAAAKAGVADRVTFIWGDLFQVDLRPATVVTLYLTADMNLRLRPRLLAELKPGTPVVSHAFDMGEWTPDRSVRVYSPDGARLLNLWIIPARVQGTWAINVTFPDGELSTTAILEQNFQRLSGLLRTAAGTVPIVETSLRGDVMAFSATVNMRPGPRTIRFRGLVIGDTAGGTAEVTGGLAIDPGRWTARRL